MNALAPVSLKANDALSSVPLGAPKETHPEFRLQIPPALTPDFEAIPPAELSGMQDEAGPLSPVADIRLDDVAALRTRMAEHIYRELHQEAIRLSLRLSRVVTSSQYWRMTSALSRRPFHSPG